MHPRTIAFAFAALAAIVATVVHVVVVSSRRPQLRIAADGSAVHADGTAQQCGRGHLCPSGHCGADHTCSEEAVRSVRSRARVGLSLTCSSGDPCAGVCVGGVCTAVIGNVFVPVRPSLCTHTGYTDVYDCSGESGGNTFSLIVSQTPGPFSDGVDVDAAVRVAHRIVSGRHGEERVDPMYFYVDAWGALRVTPNRVQTSASDRLTFALSRLDAPAAITSLGSRTGAPLALEIGDRMYALTVPHNAGRAALTVSTVDGRLVVDLRPFAADAGAAFVLRGNVQMENEWGLPV